MTGRGGGGFHFFTHSRLPSELGKKPSAKPIRIVSPKRHKHIIYRENILYSYSLYRICNTEYVRHNNYTEKPATGWTNYGGQMDGALPSEVDDVQCTPISAIQCGPSTPISDPLKTNAGGRLQQQSTLGQRCHQRGSSREKLKYIPGCDVSCKT